MHPANTVVVVFVQEGCEACEAFKPLLEKIAAKFQGHVPLLVYDANDKRREVQALADRLGVHATPSTYVMRRGPGEPIGVEGALGEPELEYMFNLARHYA